MNKKGGETDRRGIHKLKGETFKIPKRLMSRQMNIELVSEIEFKNDENEHWTLAEGEGRSGCIADPFVIVIKCLTRINCNWIWLLHTTYRRYAAQ